MGNSNISSIKLSSRVTNWRVVKFSLNFISYKLQSIVDHLKVRWKK